MVCFEPKACRIAILCLNETILVLGIVIWSRVVTMLEALCAYDTIAVHGENFAISYALEPVYYDIGLYGTSPVQSDIL
jgi:hypothetical protein